MPDGGVRSLFVERFVEPYTGLPLLGVGGYGTSELQSIDVVVDGETVLVLKPRSSDWHFSGHFPFEGQSRLSVIAHFLDESQATWFDEPIDQLPVRGESPPMKPSLLKRIKGKIKRTLIQAKELPEKIEYRLWKRTFRSRPHYDTFVRAATPNRDELKAMTGTIFSRESVISILCPVFNVDPNWLAKAVNSVRQQPYRHWELCLADDASTNPATTNYLKSLVGTDPRIKITFRLSNGHICAATNSAADLATGEFIALLDNDDELAVDALFQVAKAITANPNADLFYSDEDKIDANGHRYDPQFKPDWSPELLLSYNYINHFTVIRRSLFESVGRYRLGFEGSQDHDLLLRVTEKTDRVVHIPRILYHWRSLPSSTASAAGVKQYVHDAGRKAVIEACQRRGITATIDQPEIARKLNLPILRFTRAEVEPSITIIVTGTEAACDETITAIQSGTAYRDQVIVTNHDDSAAGRNRIAATVTTNLILFIDGGLTVGHDDWLSQLVANLRPGIGVVGPLIRDELGAIVSAGVITDLRDGAGPGDAFAGQSPNPVSYYFYAEVTRNVSAVSGRCLLTSKAIFDELDGFDAEHFPRTSFDLDYCARARGRGHRCVYVGAAVVVDSTRECRADDPVEIMAYRHRYGNRPDPFHNPNCSRSMAFGLGEEPAIELDRSPIRALVFAHNLAAAEGAPRYLSDLIVGLTQRESMFPRVICGRGGAGEEVYRSAKIPVMLFDEPWGVRIIDGLWSREEYRDSVRFFRKKLRFLHPEMLIANTLLAFPIIEAAARERIPSTWIIHESYSTEVLSRVFSPFAKGRCEAAFALASRVIPCSHDTAKLFAHLNVRGTVRVRHNAIDPSEIDAYCQDHPKPVNDQVRIIAVGTICERKGQHTLVEAAATLTKSHQNFVVELVGAREGVPYLDFVRQLIVRRGLAAHVRLIPETDAKPYFRTADIFVCTSHMETYSRSMLEAEAFGLPIVSTACQGVSEQVTWGENALRFQTGEAADLAQQLAKLIKSTELRDRMGRSSRAMFECHPNFESMLNSFESVIRHSRYNQFV